MKIIFAGTPDFAARALAAIHAHHQIVAVLTQPDRPAGRGLRLTSSPVKQLALQYGIPVLQPATLKSDEARLNLAALDADVMVVAAYGLILPKKILQIPRYGCLNIHASLLPRWRGAAPIQRAILAGDNETGITIMQMDEGLDTGDMLLKHACPITARDTAATLHDRLADMGANSIIEALQLMLERQLAPIRQDDTAACYAPKLTKEEARIDWRKDAQLIEREIRAFNPFPVSHTGLGGTIMKIWQAGLNADKAGRPGEILEVSRLGIVVACGKDALCLETLQRPGGKVQTAAQFLQSVRIEPGDMFDAG